MHGDSEQSVTVFVCAVCKKDFKSKGQMSNHETSKAHKKKLKVGGITQYSSKTYGTLLAHLSQLVVGLKNCHAVRDVSPQTAAAGSGVDAI